MRRLSRASTLVSGLVVLGATTTTLLAGETGQLARGMAEGFSYVEVVTHDANPDEELPMIIVLHSMGFEASKEVPYYSGFAEPARLILPHGSHPYESGYSWFPEHYYDSDSAFQSEVLQRTADELSSFVVAMKSRRPTVGLPTVIGMSQGGDLSLVLGLHHPELFAAVFSLAPNIPEDLLPKVGDTVGEYPPINILHGRIDSIVPIESSRRTAKALREVGIGVQLDEYPDTGHTISEEMQRDFTQRIDALLIRFASGR